MDFNIPFEHEDSNHLYESIILKWDPFNMW